MPIGVRGLDPVEMSEPEALPAARLLVVTPSRTSHPTSNRQIAVDLAIPRNVPPLIILVPEIYRLLAKGSVQHAIY